MTRLAVRGALRPLLALLLTFTLAAAARAQDAATLGTLPEVVVMTALKSGDWDDLGDLTGEALDDVTDIADDRDIRLSKTAVVIYEMAGLKTFRARIGYVLDGQARKQRPFGTTVELRQLKGPAYVARGVGGAAQVIPVRRKVLDELEKPSVKRLKGIETIELFYGDMDGKDTRVEVYGPLR